MSDKRFGATTEQERQECEQRPGETLKQWLVRMLEFQRDSHKWFIENPQTDSYVGDADFHRMVTERYCKMIAAVELISEGESHGNT